MLHTLRAMIQTNYTQKSKLENDSTLKRITILYKSNKNAKKQKTKLKLFELHS